MKKLTILVVLMTTAIGFSQNSFAREEVGTIVGVKESGWATRMNESVKQTISAGDVLYQGDILDVKIGNHVQIALEGNRENILHVDGNTVVQIFKDQTTHVDLTHGKVYALLDNLAPASTFQISTPTAVSTVRGTYFQAQTNGALSQTTVYQGLVKVHGRQKNGRAVQGDITLKPAETTIIRNFGQEPSDALRVRKNQFNEINRIIQLVGGSRALLDYNEAIGQTAQGQDYKSRNADVNADAQAKTDADEFDDGMVIF